jgi:hypothetical protein
VNARTHMAEAGYGPSEAVRLGSGPPCPVAAWRVESLVHHGEHGAEAAPVVHLAARTYVQNQEEVTLKDEGSGNEAEDIGGRLLSTL